MGMMEGWLILGMGTLDAVMWWAVDGLEWIGGGGSDCAVLQCIRHAQHFNSYCQPLCFY